jgi:hypothetical protein
MPNPKGFMGYSYSIIESQLLILNSIFGAKENASYFSGGMWLCWQGLLDLLGQSRRGR